jgi:hypothetical protein
MANQIKNSTLRNLILDISEIDETQNPFAIALKMANALRNNEITSEQYDLLSGNLFLNCKRYNIETSNEICSLF